MEPPDFRNERAAHRRKRKIGHIEAAVPVLDFVDDP